MPRGGSPAPHAHHRTPFRRSYATHRAYICVPVIEQQNARTSRVPPNHVLDTTRQPDSLDSRFEQRFRPKLLWKRPPPSVREPVRGGERLKRVATLALAACRNDEHYRYRQEYETDDGDHYDRKQIHWQMIISLVGVGKSSVRLSRLSRPHAGRPSRSTQRPR